MTDTIRDVYSRITDKIVADLEQGVRQWMKPWNADHAMRRTRKGRQVVKPPWSRIAPALQLPAVFKSAVGRQLRRTAQGGVQIRCAVAVFG